MLSIIRHPDSSFLSISYTICKWDDIPLLPPSPSSSSSLWPWFNFYFMPHMQMSFIIGSLVQLWFLGTTLFFLLQGQSADSGGQFSSLSYFCLWLHALNYHQRCKRISRIPRIPRMKEWPQFGCGFHFLKILIDFPIKLIHFFLPQRCYWIFFPLKMTVNVRPSLTRWFMGHGSKDWIIPSHLLLFHLIASLIGKWPNG